MGPSERKSKIKVLSSKDNWPSNLTSETTKKKLMEVKI